MKNVFIVRLVLLFFLVNIIVVRGEEDPFTMRINDKTPEALRLFKIKAQGLLPQIFLSSEKRVSNINERKKLELQTVVKNNSQKLYEKKPHFLQSSLSP